MCFSASITFFWGGGGGGGGAGISIAIFGRSAVPSIVGLGCGFLKGCGHSGGGGGGGGSRLVSCDVPWSCLLCLPPLQKKILDLVL